MLQQIAGVADRIGDRLNWVVERICALLVGVLVVVIWFEVLERYFLELGMTWAEEFARYVMIWAALLAVPCGVYRREHIGLEFLANILTERKRRWLRMMLDGLGLCFFVFLTFFGVGMTANGRNQFAPIFGMTMVVPFASVPISSALASFQMVVAMLRDFARTPSDRGVK